MIADADQSRLEALLVRWEQLRHDGHDATVEELCPGSPDLASELGRRIAAQRRLYEFLNLSEVDATTSLISPHRNSSGQARESANSKAEYRDLRFHAAGGLGEVYLARNSELSRDVALKFLKQDKAANPDNLRRFLLEAEVTSRLEHPGIVPVYSLGADAQGAPCYAMRFIRGETLQDALEAFHASEGSGRHSAERSLALRSLLQRFISACSTVAYAHSRGILHRDLKPSNVIVGKYDETLVVDWGLAKAFSRHDEQDRIGEETLTPSSLEYGPATPTVGAVGTPAYMSPEQAEARWDLVGPASDVYSLGATLHAILTGKAPFHGRNIVEVLEKVKRGEFVPPRQINARVDRALDAIVRKAMAPRPEIRYQSPLEIAADLNLWLADQPVSAHQEPLTVRLLRWIRRHKQWVAVAAALVCLGVLGLAFHDWLISKEEQKTRDQLGMTRTALRHHFDVVANNLAAVPGTEKLREKLAREVLETYNNLLKLYPNDPDIRFETADVFRILGDILRLTGQLDEPEVCFNHSIELFHGLLAQSHRTKDTGRWLVKALIDRGELYRMNGRSKAADRDYTTALTSLESIKIYDGLLYKFMKSEVCINRSEVLTLRGKPEQAFQDSEQAVKLLESLAGDRAPTLNPDQVLLWLAMALTDRGVAAKDLGDFDGSEQDLTRALEIAGQIPSSSIYSDDAQWQSAVALNRFGTLMIAVSGRREESIKRFESAFTVLETLAKSFPAITVYREELAVSLSGRSRSYMLADRLVEADLPCRQARIHLDELLKLAPANPQYLSLLGEATAIAAEISKRAGKSGEHRRRMAEAIAAFDRAVGIDPDRQNDKDTLSRLKAEQAAGPG